MSNLDQPGPMQQFRSPLGTDTGVRGPLAAPAGEPPPDPRNAAGVLVPIGTFNEGRNVMLWAGVSPESFTTLTVTREQADGDQASSGEKVLVGRIVSG